VFEVAQGQPVNIHATAVTPDGVVWFGSGEDLREQWRGQTFGLASYTERPTTDTTRPPSGHFDYYDPIALGAIEYNILEIQALDDGRLVLGFPTSGLLVWTPGDVKGHRLTVAEGLPGQKIGRMTTDRMHSPPLLMVPTDGGLAVFRDVP